MKLPRRNFLHLAAGTAALPAVSRIAWAQAYPARPVRIVAPTGPGRGAQSCPAWKVLQLATCPDRSPVMNQRVRCRKAARSFPAPIFYLVAARQFIQAHDLPLCRFLHGLHLNSDSSTNVGSRPLGVSLSTSPGRT